MMLLAWVLGAGFGMIAGYLLGRSLKADEIDRAWRAGVADGRKAGLRQVGR